MHCIKTTTDKTRKTVEFTTRGLNTVLEKKIVNKNVN